MGWCHTWLVFIWFTQFALNLFVMWVERRLCASVVKEATLWVKEVDGVAPSFPA